MIVLNQAQNADVQAFARKLLNDHRDGLQTFEQAAQKSAEVIYNEFRQANGDPAFALVHVYRLCQTDELTTVVKQAIDPKVSKLWMALMGTIGDDPSWCSRQQSKGHKAIAAGSSSGPMLKAAFTQIGVRLATEEGEEKLEFKQAAYMTNYFHVSTALGSPFIPAQEEFVIPHKIQSVIGVGGEFVSQAFYILLGFSKVAISEADAKKFTEVSAFLSTLLAIYDGKGLLWN